MNLLSKSKQKKSRTADNSFAPSRFKYPAISVIIPLYNAEKYIGECLDSILAQTFQNFEVIVVDDCSTDSSCAVVESYAEKFGGRLRLVHMKKNSGSGTEPRNRGLAYSRGEYLYFMDNDDAITPTALEELYTLAKKFDADVVSCEKIYKIPEKFWYNPELRKQIKPIGMMGQNFFVHEPLVWENNFDERIRILSQRKLLWNYWVQLFRRDFIVQNSMKMVGIMSDDVIFTICAICSAKRYVLVPNVIYFYRVRNDSLIHKNFDVPKHLNIWMTMLKTGMTYLDEFLSRRKIFSQRSDLKYVLFNLFVNEMLIYFVEIYTQVPAHKLDELLRKEFSSGDNIALTSFIFSAMNVQRLQLIDSRRRIAQLEAEVKRLQNKSS